MMKKGLCLLLALCCAFLLGGCTGGRIEEDQTPVSTLPPAEARYSAPDGDEAIPDVREYNMYFPGRDGLSLVSRSVKLETDNLNDAVEKLTNCLFSFRGDGEAKALGGEQPLALYGAHPIEISGGVCTVNLARSVMNLKKTSDYYKNCVAIATTLCELKEINGVNVLVADQSFPLDIAGLLPVGTMMANSGASLQGQWEQMDARKTPINGDPEKTPLSALATIYYPLPDNRGVGCAMRRLNFAGQTPAQLTSGLIDEISSVRRSLTGGEKFPELKSLLLHEPVLSELEGSRRILTLSLREDAAEKLEEARTDVACFDHTFGNVSVLLYLDSLGLKARILDDYTEMEVISRETAAVEDSWSYFSLLNISGTAKGISIRDAKYPLDDGEITSEYQFGISNEVLPGRTARISVREGRLLLVKVF